MRLTNSRKCASSNHLGTALKLTKFTGCDSFQSRSDFCLEKDANRKEEEEGEDEDEDEGGFLVRFVGGIPKTIDDDIPSTIISLGFQSAVSTASQAIVSARDGYSRAESHGSIIVVECMGRGAEFLTLYAGDLAGGADAILIYLSFH